MESSNLSLSKDSFLFVKNITNCLLPSLERCLQNKSNITLSLNKSFSEPLINVGTTFQNERDYIDTFFPLILEECRQSKPNELESSYDLSLSRTNIEDLNYHKKRKNDVYNQRSQGVIEKVLYKSEILESESMLSTDVENITTTASNQVNDLSDDKSCKSNAKSSKASVWILNVKLLDNSSGTCEFSGGDLIYMTTTVSSSSDQQQFLGVAFSIDMQRSSNNEYYNFMKLYVCLNQNPTFTTESSVSSSLSRTNGSQNGWIREEYIYEGAKLHMTSLTNITPSLRETAAIHSLYKLNPSTRNLLLTGRYQSPSTSTATTTSSLSSSSNLINQHQTVSNIPTNNTDIDASKPPLNVPVELWQTLCRTYNNSQLLAIRDVCVSDTASGIVVILIIMSVSIFLLSPPHFKLYLLLVPAI